MVLGIDIGASSVKAALVGDDAGWRIVRRLDPVDIHTRTFDELRRAVERICDAALAADPRISRVGVSTTGSASPDDVVISSGFYSGYAAISWREVLAHHSEGRITTVRVLNDGRAAAYGCYLADGHARGRDLVHFVVGTGIGGGMVSGGRLFNGSHNFAGAYGHIKVDPRGTARCVCGGRGCVELHAAAPAVARLATERGIALDEADGRGVRQLGELARGGSEPARAVFREAGTWLGIAIGAVANVCDPDVVTVGGGVVAAAAGQGGNWYVDTAGATAREMVIPRIAEHLEVVAASLLNDAALIGAAALAAEAPALPRPAQ